MNRRDFLKALVAAAASALLGDRSARSPRQRSHQVFEVQNGNKVQWPLSLRTLLTDFRSELLKKDSQLFGFVSKIALLQPFHYSLVRGI